MKKLCCDCNTEKDISEFNKQPDRKYGVAGRCRECQSIYHKQWYTKNKERMKERFRRNNYFSRYNITIADYEKLLEKQNNCCAICYSKTGSANKRLAVDHNHQTGIIRGLLCDECNTGLGKFKDNPSLLTNAIAYLIKN